ncbi:MAG: ATP-binding cassette domain-containing protein [Chloroflexota bacterium]|nr:ATP-binding cassette domain-containing protein [Chloroflexota bacterium]
MLVDGVDARDWSFDALRWRISTTEQDTTLSSLGADKNIGFSVGQQAHCTAIVEAAREAQGHGFIVELLQGQETVIGKRGVTLSSGQRHRLTIARASLSSSRILILDDSTSGINRASEDKIERTICRRFESRTTLLSTHRPLQIRLADWVLPIARHA